MLLLLKPLRQPLNSLSLREQQSEKDRVSDLVSKVRFSKVNNSSIFDNSFVYASAGICRQTLSALTMARSSPASICGQVGWSSTKASVQMPSRNSRRKRRGGEICVGVDVGAIFSGDIELEESSVE